MIIRLESRLGIWLNTPFRFLEKTAEQNLRGAKNDASWFVATSEGTVATTRNVAFLVRSAEATYIAMANERGNIPALESARNRALPSTMADAHRIPSKFVRWLAKRGTRSISARVLARIRAAESRNLDRITTKQPKQRT